VENLRLNDDAFRLILYLKIASKVTISYRSTALLKAHLLRNNLSLIHIKENLKHDTIIIFDKLQNILAERGFDPRTSGLWAQHASTAPLCFS
jgi:hypothetical protein